MADSSSATLTSIHQMTPRVKQYLLGQEAEYLADDNGDGELDQDELDVRRSRTTFLQPQFGVTMQFADDGE
ncbi:MAG: hypothetical protein BRD30_13485 [Bacteroidetes bacterium QH_2_63_10]|nr:MAG: hypothetical protein BRD30_13485 [Bacteroidetes bacterium QH_2_63_10]